MSSTIEIQTENGLKKELDALWVKYETRDFIKDDPVQFVHLFKNLSPKDIEIAGFLSSLYAFGRRDVFIKKLNSIFNFMGMKPFDFISNFKPDMPLDGLDYRFIKPCDLSAFFASLHNLYVKDKMTLEELFFEGYKTKKDVFSSLQYVCDYFYKFEEKSAGYKFMLSNPKNKGAMKRMNMFLRWMVRKNSPVDIGIWDFISPSGLLIPLDVHVGNISRSQGLLIRKQNDYKSVIELTSKLKTFDPEDPVKYDFALFGFGVNRAK